jgi:hypothetical protein
LYFLKGLFLALPLAFTFLFQKPKIAGDLRGMGIANKELTDVFSAVQLTVDAGLLLFLWPYLTNLTKLQTDWTNVTQWFK